LHLNCANSLPDSDLSLIDVSPWGSTGQGVARQVAPSALARERNAAVDLRWSFYDKNRQCGM
jgi:hypothetical protein